jgi:hypothetical protein
MRRRLQQSAASLRVSKKTRNPSFLPAQDLQLSSEPLEKHPSIARPLSYVASFEAKTNSQPPSPVPLSSIKFPELRAYELPCLSLPHWNHS